MIRDCARGETDSGLRLGTGSQRPAPGPASRHTSRDRGQSQIQDDKLYVWASWSNWSQIKFRSPPTDTRDIVSLLKVKSLVLRNLKQQFQFKHLIFDAYRKYINSFIERKLDFNFNSSFRNKYFSRNSNNSRLAKIGTLHQEKN